MSVRKDCTRSRGVSPAGRRGRVSPSSLHSSCIPTSMSWSIAASRAAVIGSSSSFRRLVMGVSSPGMVGHPAVRLLSRMMTRGLLLRQFGLVSGPGYVLSGLFPGEPGGVVHACQFLNAVDVQPPVEGVVGGSSPFVLRVRRGGRGLVGHLVSGLRFSRSLSYLFSVLWSRRRESNPRHAGYKAAALPLSYAGSWGVSGGPLQDCIPAQGRPARFILFIGYAVDDAVGVQIFPEAAQGVVFDERFNLRPQRLFRHLQGGLLVVGVGCDVQLFDGRLPGVRRPVW